MMELIFKCVGKGGSAFRIKVSVKINVHVTVEVARGAVNREGKKSRGSTVNDETFLRNYLVPAYAPSYTDSIRLSD